MSVKNSVIEEELINLNKLINIWWHEEGPVKALHTINPVKNQMMLESLLNIGYINKIHFDSKTPLKGLKILDAGCGGGLCTESIARLGAEVVGVDPSTPMINLAKYHATLDDSFKNLEYYDETIEEHSIKNEGKYDVVISCGVLEHLTDYDLYLEACAKCLKKGGSIFASTFNKTFLGWLIGKWAYEYVFNMVPKGVHDYNMFVSPNVVTEVLERYGCKTALVEGLFCLPFSGMKWFRVLPQVFYTLHAVKC